MRDMTKVIVVRGEDRHVRGITTSVPEGFVLIRDLKTGGLVIAREVDVVELTPEIEEILKEMPPEAIEAAMDDLSR